MTPYNGPERRKHPDAMTENRLSQIEERLDRGNKRLDQLDEGQLHIIKTLNNQDAEQRAMRDEMKRNTDATRRNLEATETVIGLAQNMQSAARFFNAIFDGVTWLLHKISAASKLLWPIVALGALIWGLVYAWLHGGKPPSVG